MSTESELWRQLAHRLQVEVIAPFVAELSGGSVVFAALLPQFGDKAGMVVDPKWSVIKPHADELVRNGYGYSAVELGHELDDESVQEMLRDWSWTSETPPPLWM